MALKFDQDSWIAAENENRELRDTLRKQFWVDMGIRPATETAEIDIAPEKRLGLMQALLEKTMTGREQDENLKLAASLSQQNILTIELGVLPVIGSGLKMPKWADLNLSNYQKFFLSWHVSTYERSRIDE